jgi:hypothetical protein
MKNINILLIRTYLDRSKVMPKLGRVVSFQIAALVTNPEEAQGGSTLTPSFG